MRVAERSVEGRHSNIHRIQKRAPRSNVPYLSLEMRFSHLRQLAATRPSILKGMSDSVYKMETKDGIKRAVMFPGFKK